MRIASLLASATESVCELGLGDQLVAISHECDHPPEALSKPRVSRPLFEAAGLGSGEIDRAVRDAVSLHGGVYELDVEKLREVRPDLILAQGLCEVCAVPAATAGGVVALLDGEPRVLSLDAHTIEEILDGIRSVGSAAGVLSRAEAYVAGLRRRLDQVAGRVKGRPRRRVLAIEWLEPVFVPGHWTPEMVELAGGELLIGDAGLPSRQVTWDELEGLDPDVLLVMPCGYRLERGRQDAAAHRERLCRVARRAVDAGQAFVLNGSDYFNRSGPRVVTGVEILGALLHPELFGGYDLAGKAEVWGQ
ncbi:MAG: cobalamin-binding protein [Gemmatimonadales bacterium]